MLLAADGDVETARRRMDGTAMMGVPNNLTANMQFRRRTKEACANLPDASPKLPDGRPKFTAHLETTEPASHWGRTERAAPKPQMPAEEAAPVPTGRAFKDEDGVVTKHLDSSNAFWA